MATSLRQQLQRLSGPHAVSLTDTRFKVSLLFDSKEAATKDRRTIYELGLSGLQELIAINPNFQQFEDTLFDENTINMERSVEHSEVNRLLDLNIEKFLHHIAPYFLLRPAHMCLEWLLRRFYIHEYNRNALIALALPYHETNICVRVLQCIRIRANDQEWGWLRRNKKMAVPVTKPVLIKHATTNVGFLTFVCHNTQEAIRELGPYAQHLQTQINFYASIVVGTLNNVNFVGEKYVVSLLPSLLQGFNSISVDFVSAVYIIVSQLVSRTQLTAKLCKSFVKHVANVSFEQLQPAAVLLLICIFDTQQTQPELSEATLLHLASQKWLIEILASLTTSNMDVYPLCEPLLKGAVAAIHNNTEMEVYKAFLKSFLDNIKFPNSTVQKIINCILSSYVASPVTQAGATAENDDEDVIALSSDDEEMTEVDNNFQSWYSNYLQRLEHQYPDAFDATVKEALNSNTTENSNKKKAIKIVIGFRLKSFGQDATEMYESLYHHTSNTRRYAMRQLLGNLDAYKERPQNWPLLQECLNDRLRDDSELVVHEVLRLSTQQFIDVLGPDKFMAALFHVLDHIHKESTSWAPLLPRVLTHMTAREVVQQYDNNLILLALMPLLFPHESSTIAKDCIEQILISPLAKQMSFLQELQVAAAQKEDAVFSLTAFKKHFLDVVSCSKATPTVQELFQSVQSQSHDFFSTAMQLSHFLLLLTACCKKRLSSAECQLVYKQINVYTKRFQIKHLGTQQWKQMKQNSIPLQLYSDFLTTLTQYTDFEDLLQWEQRANQQQISNDNLQCFLLIFGELAENAFSQPRTSLEKYEWSKLLKDVCDVVFKTPQAKFDFLINFYVYEQLPQVEDYAALRVRSLKLMNALLKNSENTLTISTAHILKMTVALTVETDVLRLLALETLTLAKERLREHLKYFVEDVLDCSHEIGMDHEQYPLILYTTLKTSKQAGEKILNALLSALTATDALQQHPIYTAALLRTLKHVNDEQILTQLVPLGMAAMLQYQLDDSAVRMLTPPYSCIYQSVLERFDAQTIENALLDDTQVWQFIERSFQQHDVYLQWEQKLQTVPCFVLQTLDGQTYKQLPELNRHALVRLIVQTIAQSRNDALFLVANKFLKKCDIDCAPLVTLLEQMYAQMGEGKSQKPKRKTPAKPESKETFVHTTAWHQGTVVLELLEGKRRLHNMQLLIPPLFELLKYCLAVEEQAAVEYTKQLTLSALLHACQKSQEQGIVLPDVLPKTTFRIDQIVQCLRTTQNPQTHNNALLLLSHCATLYPQQVLHNIVDIFTFMGSSVVRHDDAFSFHIINNIIESIVPILVQHRQQGGESAQVIPVLKVFSDIMLDVPEHRRLPLYTKLLQTLGAERYLWNFLCVVFEALVIDEEKQRLLQKQKPTQSETAEKLPKRLEIVLELSNAFEPSVVLESCIQLLQYLKTLQVNIEPAAKVARKSTSANAEVTELSLFDVQTHTAKQLRHFKYAIMQYLSAVSNAPVLLRKIAQLGEAELLTMKPLYQEFIIKILSFVPVLNAAIEQCVEQSHMKFWKVLLHHVHDLLDNAISLLSPDMFLLVVTGLMQHQVLSIRKKVIELLISKLQQRDAYFETCDDEHFRNLLQPLTGIVDGILTPQSGDATSGISSPHSSSSNELVYIQQNALIAIKLLSKLFALKYIDDFKSLLANLTKIAKRRKQIPKILLATVILAMVGISSNLKAHSLAYLPKYMPQLIELLQEQSEQVRQQAPDHVCIALIASIQKLVESLPLFLGPYMVDIITALSSISARIQAQNNQKDVRTTTALNRVSTIWTKLAQDVPVRVLVPACEKAYKRLLATQSHADITVLMQLLHTSITNADNADLSSVQSELSNFFLEALSLRQQLHTRNDLSESSLQSIEASVIEAFVAWVLKLSESAFRPLFQRVYEWALQQSPQKTNILTYFLLTNKIAEALKSLFVLFAGDFIDDAARLLDECHAGKATIDPDEERIHTQLLHAIFSTLHNVFLHDSKKFMTAQRFEVLLQPIVDQLENRLVLEDEALQSLLTACLAQLAVAVSSDMLWKQLNYQVLLKTRTNVPEVRMLAFNCCVEIARKLGDDFTTLLPETVPFIAELFEDENARVEKNTRKSVQELEVILGESLQKYL